ncbi:MAG: Tad domain-containing protein [Deltaproteobacteria bacterium]|nr:Tad domain-containing protein [Deltaproteobacteria bacterium]
MTEFTHHCRARIKEILRGKAGDRGIFIVLLAVGLFALFGLVLLVVGTAFLSTNRNKLQASVNLAALAAMEEFINQGGGSNYLANSAAARDKANAILRENKLIGASGLLGDLKRSDPALDQAVVSPGGEIQFGLWHREYPGFPAQACSGTPTQCPCGNSPSDYPCFRPNDNPIPTTPTFANAVRIRARTQDNNKIFIPLAKLFGPERFGLAAEATITLVQRCTALLSDLSLAVTQESHSLVGVSRALSIPPTPPPPQPPPNRILNQPTGRYNFGLMVMKQAEIAAGNCNNLGSASADQLMWCNLSRTLAINGVEYLNRDADTDYFKHYRSDYKLVNTPYGQMQIQNYAQPSNGVFIGEPFSRFFMALNAALRLLSIQSSGADLTVMTVFRGAINPAQDRWPTNSGFTNDTGMLQQLTNVLNLGTSGSVERHPNFVDKGWFPLASDGVNFAGNNLTLALVTAINDLSSCPANSRKAIVLTSTGIPTCSYPIDFASGTFPASSVCDGRYETYNSATRAELLNQILPELKKRRIALTVIWQGTHLDTNFINRQVDGRFIDLNEALVSGFSGYGAAPDQKIFEDANAPSTSPCPPGGSNCSTLGAECFGQCMSNANRFAYLNNGLTFGGNPVYFREANGVLGKLAIDSGGLACPLMRLCQPADCTGGGACYETDPDDPTGPRRLAPQHRQVNQPQRCAVKERSMTEQAAYCAAKAIADSPYLLVEEKS